MKEGRREGGKEALGSAGDRLKEGRREGGSRVGVGPGEGRRVGGTGWPTRNLA